MQLSYVLAAATVGLAGVSSAFVVECYRSGDCSGSSQHVNVYDNTCADWMDGFNSIKVAAYGGSHQKAFFCSRGGCGGSCKEFWADGGDPNFKIGQCWGKSLGGTKYSAGSFLL